MISRVTCHTCHVTTALHQVGARQAGARAVSVQPRGADTCPGDRHPRHVLHPGPGRGPDTCPQPAGHVSSAPSARVQIQVLALLHLCHRNSQSNFSLFDPKLKDVCWPRSRHASITCPPPSVPYKCVCLGGDGEVTRTGTRGYNTRSNNTLSRTRVPGNITENTCSCSWHVAVTRAVCCHARDQDTRGSVIAV